MVYGTVLIPAATSAENLQALEEVKDFFTTDLGRGGKKRWIYHLLPEEVLDSKLVELADPQTRSSIDIITFQPCDTYELLNQDRFSAEEWDLPGGRWTFSAIYDGHCGHDTVDYVQSNLPPLVKASLEGLLQSSGHEYLSDPSQISRILSGAVQQVDQGIVDALFRLFPQTQLEQMSDDEVEQHLHLHQSEWSDLAARCTQGSTVLAALSDPSRRNLWVVNLGDSQAVLGLRSPEADNGWSTKVLNSSHNGNNAAERQRVVQEHPGEPHCLADNRLIGYLAPTRAIGDTWLKIPAIYTHKLFSRHHSDWLSPPRSQLFASRIITPPYVSNIPEVYHTHLPRADLPKPNCFLVLCSDGLVDLYDGYDVQLTESEMSGRWVAVVARCLDSVVDMASPSRRNFALDLLRDALCGGDIRRLSRNLTLEMDEKWMDDVTISVQCFM